LTDLFARWGEWLNGWPRRWKIAGVTAVVLLIMAFYAVTDPARLSGNMALTGADYAGYAVCHRITSRSFTVAGRQMPLCARCTGMYLGAALTFAALALAGRRRWTQLPNYPILLTLIGFVGLMGIDGVNSYTHFFPNFPHVYTPQNWLRLATGLGTGLMMGAILFPALAQTLWYDQVDRPSITSFRELEGLVLLAGLAALLVLSDQPTIAYILALISGGGVVMILTALNSMILLIVLRRDAQARRWREAAAPLLIGLVLAIAQISAISIFRYNWTGTMTGFPGM
jgi:uncharacterized membrane protein